MVRELIAFKKPFPEGLSLQIGIEQVWIFDVGKGAGVEEGRVQGLEAAQDLLGILPGVLCFDNVPAAGRILQQSSVGRGKQGCRLPGGSYSVFAAKLQKGLFHCLSPKRWNWRVHGIRPKVRS
jgi:hypothetical protein